MKNQKLFSFLTIILISLFLVPSFVRADLVPCGGYGEPACQICHLFVMLDGILRFIFLYIIFPVSVLLLVYGGATLMLSAGDPGKINQGKSILFSVIGGLIIIFSAWIVVNTFMTAIGMGEWVWRTEPGQPILWYQIHCPI